MPRLAGAQIRFQKNPREAARAVVGAMAKAARRGARFLVTPEMILTGYHNRFSESDREEALRDLVVPACAHYKMTLCLGDGSFQDKRGRKVRKPYNQVTVIGPQGRILGVHHKTLPTDGDLSWCSRGNPRSLSTYHSQGLRFGCLICNDYWATPVFTSLPDLGLPQRLSRLGAKAIFHSIASGHGRSHLDFHSKRLEERSHLAKVFTATANGIHDARKPMNAPSGLVGPDGRWRTQLPMRGEGVWVAST